MAVCETYVIVDGEHDLILRHHRIGREAAGGGCCAVGRRRYCMVMKRS